MKNKLLTGVALGLLALGAGCSSESSSSGGGEDKEVQLEIFSWWTSADEKKALTELIDVHVANHPKHTVTNAADAFADKARERLDERIDQGIPPATFQENIGAKMLAWILVNGSDAADSVISPLNDVAERNDWDTFFPPEVIDAVSYDGNIYAVPVNIHRQNNMYYNAQLLADAGVEPPETLEELTAFLDAMVEAGVEKPLCVGNTNNWTLEFLIFEGILPAVGGADYHDEFWSGRGDPTGAEIDETLDYALGLMPYFNENHGELNWSEGVLLLEDGSCAATMMGDWAKGALINAGMTPEDDFLQRPFPGTRGNFIFSGDAFPLPKGVRDIGAVEELLETFGSKEGQLAFNKIKGSIPARNDANPDDLDASGQKQYADFQGDTKLRSYRAIVPADAFSGLGKASTDFMASGDKDLIIFELENSYGRLK